MKGGIDVKISIILGHPYEKSFNHAIAQAILEQLHHNRHDIHFHDLYTEAFDPVMPKEELVSDYPKDPIVLQHIEEIQQANGIIIIHPNWWGQPPAILKGWVDRVLRHGVAYTFPDGDSGGGLPIGVLRAKAGIVINTSNTPEERENTVFGDPLERIWKACIMEYCGVSTFERMMFRVIDDSTTEDRQNWLKQAKDIVNRYFP